MAISKLNITDEQIQQAVIDQMVKTLLENASWSEESDNLAQVESRVLQQMEARLDKVITEMVNRTVDGAVAPIIERGIEDAMLQEHTRLGSPKGDAMSFNDWIANIAECYLKEKVNKKTGEPPKAGFGSERDLISRLHYLVFQQTNKTITDAVRDAVAAMREAMGDILANDVKVVINRRIQDLSQLR